MVEFDNKTSFTMHTNFGDIGFFPGVNEENEQQRRSTESPVLGAIQRSLHTNVRRISAEIIGMENRIVFASITSKKCYGHY
jgi:hypothetical protein